jgi:hypothetical protein
VLSTDLSKSNISSHMLDLPRITGDHTVPDLLPSGLGENRILLWLYHIPEPLGEVAP